MRKVKVKVLMGFIVMLCLYSSTAIQAASEDYEVILGFEYDEITDFYDGMAAVRKGELWGYVNEKFEWVVEPQYLFAGKFVDGHTYVLEQIAEGIDHSKIQTKDFVMNIIDKEGNILMTSKQVSKAAKTSLYPTNIFCAGEGVIVFVLESTGQHVAFKADGTYLKANDTIKEYCKKNHHADGIYYIGKAKDQQMLVIIPEYNEKNEVINEVIGLVTLDGELQIIEVQSEKNIIAYNRDIHDDMIAIKEIDNGTSKVGLVNFKGEWIIEPQYEELVVEDTLIRVKKDGKWGVISRNGDELISCTYDGIGKFSDESATVYKEGKAGRISLEDKVIIPLAYDRLYYDAETKGAIVAGTDKNHVDRPIYGYIDSNGRKITSMKFNSCTNFTRDIALVELNGHFYYIGRSGNKLREVNFGFPVTAYSDFSEDEEKNLYIKVETKGKVGVIKLLDTDTFIDKKKQFKDFNEEHWAHVYLRDEVASAITGYEDGTFRPNGKVTVDTLIKTLVEINFGKVENGSTHWNEKRREIAVKNGYLEGLSYTKNDFNEAVTRKDAMVMIANALRTKGITFYDETVLHSFSDREEIEEDLQDEIALVVYHDIIGGYGDQTIRLEETLNRGVLLAILGRYYELVDFYSAQLLQESKMKEEKKAFQLEDKDTMITPGIHNVSLMVSDINPKYKTELTELAMKYQAAIIANEEWVKKYVAKHIELGTKDIPWHKNFGVTEQEYKRIIEFSKEIYLVEKESFDIEIVELENGNLMIAENEKIPFLSNMTFDFDNNTISNEIDIMEYNKEKHIHTDIPGVGICHGARWDQYYAEIPLSFELEDDEIYGYINTFIYEIEKSKKTMIIYRQKIIINHGKYTGKEMIIFNN